ncbi:MAG: AMP-binding protein [Acidimicrobiales bacterium]
MPCDTSAVRTTSSTRAAWYPRSASTVMPASSSFAIVLRPCRRSSRPSVGAVMTAASSLRSTTGPLRALLLGSTASGDPDGADVLGEVVDEAAARFGDATAYVAADGWLLSFAELARASDEVAAGLAAAGVGAGDVVALALPSIPEYVIAYAAAAKLGAVTAGVNARLTSHERAGVLATARPRLVVATPDLAPHPDALPAGADLVTIDVAGAPGDALASVRVEGGAPRRSTPTRTARWPSCSPPAPPASPKGAVFGAPAGLHHQVDTGGTWAGQAGAAQLAGTRRSPTSGPMTKLPGNLMWGACTVLVDRWRPGGTLALIERYAMAGVGGIPTQVALMLGRHPRTSDDLSSVRAIVMGGGPSTPSLVRGTAAVRRRRVCASRARRPASDRQPPSVRPRTPRSASAARTRA